MSTPPTYKPVPVATAKAIAEQFDKSQIVIVAVDPAFACTHYSTYGVSPQDKTQAAALGDEISRHLNAGEKLATFEDFRAVPAAEAQAKIEALQRRYDEDVAELNARLTERALANVAAGKRDLDNLRAVEKDRDVLRDALKDARDVLVELAAVLDSESMSTDLEGVAAEGHRYRQALLAANNVLTRVNASA